MPLKITQFLCDSDFYIFTDATIVKKTSKNPSSFNNKRVMLFTILELSVLRIMPIVDLIQDD